MDGWVRRLIRRRRWDENLAMMIPCWGLMNWDYDYVLACACFFPESVWFDVFKRSEGCWVSVLWPSAHADYCAVFGEHDTSAPAL